MAVTEEGWFTTSDGIKLYEKTWTPSETPKAHLVAFHGFSDHINAYYDLFPTLASAPYNIAVHGIDQRGWGRSCQRPSDQGLTGPTSTVLRDMNEYATHVSRQLANSSTPLFVFGHSMGGAQALHYLLTTDAAITSTRPSFSGLILESPYVALHPSSEPLAITVAIGKLFARLMPHRQMKQHPNATYMSRSASVQADWTSDTLCHDTGTFEGLRDMLARASTLTALATSSTASPTPPGAALTSHLPCPVLWTHGTEDRVTDYATSRKLCEAIEAQKTPIWYPGAYHKLHAEPDGVGEKFAADVGAWIVDIADGKGQQGNVHQSQSPEEVRSKL